MLAKVNSCAIVGLEGTVVEVEVDSSRGLASFTLVGLPDAAVKDRRQHSTIRAEATDPAVHPRERRC
jgi:hypothetical protein